MRAIFLRAFLAWLIITPAVVLVAGCELLRPALDILGAVNAARVDAGAPPLPSSHPAAVEVVTCDVKVRDAVELERLRARVADLERGNVPAADELTVAKAQTILAIGKRTRAVERAKVAPVDVDGGAP